MWFLRYASGQTDGHIETRRSQDIAPLYLGRRNELNNNIWRNSWLVIVLVSINVIIIALELTVALSMWTCTAASSGRKDGLSSTEFGACYYNNMRLVIHVCCDNTGQFKTFSDWPNQYLVPIPNYLKVVPGNSYFFFVLCKTRWNST